MSILFGAKNFGFFKIDGVTARTIDGMPNFFQDLGENTCSVKPALKRTAHGLKNTFCTFVNILLGATGLLTA